MGRREENSVDWVPSAYLIGISQQPQGRGTVTIPELQTGNKSEVDLPKVTQVYVALKPQGLLDEQQGGLPSLVGGPGWCGFF